MIEEASLPKLSRFAATTTERVGRGEFEGFHRLRNRKRVRREQDGVPVIRQKDPGGGKKTAGTPRSGYGPKGVLFKLTCHCSWVEREFATSGRTAESFEK